MAGNTIHNLTMRPSARAVAEHEVQLAPQASALGQAFLNKMMAPSRSAARAPILAQPKQPAVLKAAAKTATEKKSTDEDGDVVMAGNQPRGSMPSVPSSVLHPTAPEPPKRVGTKGAKKFKTEQRALPAFETLLPPKPAPESKPVPKSTAATP